MKERHALWDAISSRFTANPKNANQRDALNRYNTVILCERFGWTPDTVNNLPLDLYQDIITICNLRDSKMNSPSSNGK